MVGIPNWTKPGRRDGARRLAPTLTEIANRVRSDKGSDSFNSHHYTRVYEFFLAPLAGQTVRLLEIGLLHVDHPGWLQSRSFTGQSKGTDAPSLRMWREFLPYAELFGFDINDFSEVNIEGCRIFRGDSSSSQDLQRLIEASGGAFDVVIDDASHASHHQQVALSHLYLNVKPGGYYIIEDLHWQPEELELPDATPTRRVLQALQHGETVETPFLCREVLDHIYETAQAIFFFDSLSPRDIVNHIDALCVIQKKSAR